MKTEKHTRKEIIDHNLQAAGWNVAERSQVIEEFDNAVGLPEGVSEPLRGRQTILPFCSYMQKGFLLCARRAGC